MTAWWAEHAWLGGGRLSDGVLLEEKDGRWIAVTPDVATPPPGAIRLDGLTLPGLANAHSHCFHRALRGRTQSSAGTFWSWREQMYRLAERLDPDSYHRLARAVYAEMALAGFTAVGEFHYLHHGPGGVGYDDPNEMAAALVAAAGEVGIRLTLLDACYLQGGFDAPLQGPQLRFGDGSVARWAERVERLRDGPAVKVGAAIHSVRAVPPGAMAEVAGWARARGAPLHAHVSEQRSEHHDSLALLGATPLGVLEKKGAVTAGFTAVHGTHFAAEDVAALARAGGTCCLCPTTERDLGDGIGPAGDLDRAGVALCLGTDAHAVVDGFEEARAVELHARLAAERRGVIEPDRLMEAATAGGMRSLGWEAGRLEAGKLADLVTLTLDSPRTAGCDRGSPATAVFAATAGDVRHVVSGGRTIVSEGVHFAFGDVGPALASAVDALWP